jgi:hypothetical protein
MDTTPAMIESREPNSKKMWKTNPTIKKPKHKPTAPDQYLIFAFFLFRRKVTGTTRCLASNSG